jgi:MYXO-CTERM domain-containing protein
MPSGQVCCASVGRDDIYCLSGTTCNGDGTCADAASGSTVDGNTGSTSTDGSSYTQGEYSCFSSGMPGSDTCPTIDTCCSTAACYYNAGGNQFNCAAMGDCTAAAQEMVNYCTESSGGDDGGCSVAVAPGVPKEGWSWFGWGALLALGAVVRRRARKAGR